MIKFELQDIEVRIVQVTLLILTIYHCIQFLRYTMGIL